MDEFVIVSLFLSSARRPLRRARAAIVSSPAPTARIVPLATTNPCGEVRLHANAGNRRSRRIGGIAQTAMAADGVAANRAGRRPPPAPETAGKGRSRLSLINGEDDE
ncbi:MULTISPECIES: hypothetical protein [unclassified Lysobacter]|uniref:hypothetical protein n=1 Tax=unclassified Lysobacter TaxID=2635362 RepID=UPI001BEA7140|nr:MULTISPECIES: hypothetical protein [unclassified Lysobacter]MBT2746701.1 hypothetical protein [Lysobacter sp. ISL-42]MBT2751750.1 hypothetical protein [Lysobacter sp. ISL-50]MBT2778102.1 hypothetical protein [Lysobacter sp. ISL-54]MBT2781743.1 hypothetical protein [Lysobacter sp. ISL-52]